jgi:hypothetical protein
MSRWLRLFRLPVHTVDLFDHQKDHESDDEEIYNRSEKQTVIDSNGACVLCGLQRVVVRARQIYVQIGEVDLAEQQTDGASTRH